MLVRWCDNADYTNWTASVNNQAGSYPLDARLQDRRRHADADAGDAVDRYRPVVDDLHRLPRCLGLQRGRAGVRPDRQEGGGRARHPGLLDVAGQVLDLHRRSGSAVRRARSGTPYSRTSTSIWSTSFAAGRTPASTTSDGSSHRWRPSNQARSRRTIPSSNSTGSRASGTTARRSTSSATGTRAAPMISDWIDYNVFGHPISAMTDSTA